MLDPEPAAMDPSAFADRPSYESFGGVMDEPSFAAEAFPRPAQPEADDRREAPPHFEGTHGLPSVDANAMAENPAAGSPSQGDGHHDPVRPKTPRLRRRRAGLPFGYFPMAELRPRGIATWDIQHGRLTLLYKCPLEREALAEGAVAELVAAPLRQASWSARTQQMYKTLNEAFKESGGMGLSYDAMIAQTRGALKRRVVAGCFQELLFLTTHGLTDLAQSKAYGEYPYGPPTLSATLTPRPLRRNPFPVRTNCASVSRKRVPFAAAISS